MKKSLMEKNIPLKIIKTPTKYIIVCNFNKPIGKRIVRLLDRVMDLIEDDVSKD